MDAWLAGNALPNCELGRGVTRIDAHLDQERRQTQLVEVGSVDGLPSGVILKTTESDPLFVLWWNGQWYQWRATGYQPVKLNSNQTLRACTPPSIVAALRHGYAPRTHESLPTIPGALDGSKAAQ